MAANYPEMFKAGIAYSGVPAGCFVSSSGSVNAWNSTCAQGNSIATPEAWADVVKAMDPGVSVCLPLYAALVNQFAVHRRPPEDANLPWLSRYHSLPQQLQ
jgi:hypothetical protein